jgi:serine/threonine protein kinase
MIGVRLPPSKFLCVVKGDPTTHLRLSPTTATNGDAITFQRELGKGSYATVYAALPSGTPATPAERDARIESAVKVINLREGKQYVMNSSVISELIPLNLVFPLVNTPCRVMFTDPGIVDEYHPPGQFVVQMNLAHSDLNGLIESALQETALLENQGGITRPYDTFSPEEMNLLAYEVVLAIAYTHSRMVAHMDIKSQNFLVYAVQGTDFSRAVLGGDDTVKLLALSDFGISEYNLAFPRQHDGEVITLDYRPPEMLLNKCIITYASDVWSAGCLLYEMATGHRILGLSDASTPTDALEQLMRIFGTSSMQNVYMKDVERSSMPPPPVPPQRFHQQPRTARFSRLPQQPLPHPPTSKKRKRMFYNLSGEDEDRLFFTGPSFPGTINETFEEDLSVYPGLAKVIMSMLALDPSERLTIFEVLNSQYFTDNTKRICDCTILHGARIPRSLHFTRSGAVLFSEAAVVMHGKEMALWGGVAPLKPAPEQVYVTAVHREVAHRIQLALSFTRVSYTSTDKRQIMALATNLMWQVERKNNFLFPGIVAAQEQPYAICGLAELIVDNHTYNVPRATVYNQASLLTLLEFNVLASTLNDFFELYLLSLNNTSTEDIKAAVAWELTYILAMSLTMPRKYMPSEIAAIAICIVYDIPEFDLRFTQAPLLIEHVLVDAKVAFLEFTKDQISDMLYYTHPSIGTDQAVSKRLMELRTSMYDKLLK